MNKALLLLVVTLVQSQSDGVLLSRANNNDQIEEVETSDAPFLMEIAQNPSLRKRALTSDTFTRRSALDKNFMRFGRGETSCTGESPSDKLSFYRFSRGLKDNFIRFGRGRDNFIRFGRSRPDDFFRSGKSLRENFIRFGKADRNFMRFGRDKTEEDNHEDTFGRTNKSGKDNFIRFGKSGVKEGRNGTNFLRFGKREEIEEEEGKRRKREAGFFEEEEDDWGRNRSPVSSGSSWQNLEILRNSRLTPFFPVSPNIPKNNYF